MKITVINGTEKKGVTVCIRKIREEDYPAAAQIWRDVLDVPVGDEEAARIYRAMEQDDRCFTYVAEADDAVVGLVTGVWVLAIPFPNGYIKMNGLGVLPAYRRQGIGKKLMLQVEKEAAKRGAPHIGLATGITRTEAHAFYEAIGYRKTSFWYRKNAEGHDEHIRRIERNERILEEAERLLRENADADGLRERMDALASYYGSDEWKQDYADDEAGLLPDGLKRGVLSEDGIFDLLEQYDSIEKEM
ncbi:MAG: GNAT family N-acetyltransferase [Clostridia bacterium]|nr:GNAT family N-acetyltransferase [Clostridia bacterium]